MEVETDEFKSSKQRDFFDPTDKLLHILIGGSATITQVSELIQQKAQVNKCDVGGRGAALVWAMIKGVKLEILEILLGASGTEILFSLLT